MNKVKVFILTVVIIVIGIIVLAVTTSQKIAKEDSISSVGLEKITQVLNARGVKFYGASWCPHCATQKSWFRKSAKNLPYIECSTAGAGSPQTQICVDAKIESYPTWEFANGTRISTELMPVDLAYVLNIELDETSKAELTKQKDSRIQEMTPEGQESYNKMIENLKTKLN